MKRSGPLAVAGAVIVCCGLSACGRATGSGDTTAATDGAPGSAIRFQEATATSGIDFMHVPTRTPDKLMPEIIGSGVAIVDVNRDGAPDVVLINSGALRTSARPADALNRLYINDGLGRFVDRTAEWKLPSPGYGMGVAVGDYDNDGWPDLFLTTASGDDRLLRNTGREFVDVTAAAGITPDGRWSTSAGFADVDLDGDLDVWVVRYVRYSPEIDIKVYHNGIHGYGTPVMYDGLANRLYRNNGNGTFTDISRVAGLDQDAQKGLALAIGDIDRDGDVDAYVANDTTPNHLWINDGRGRFTNVAKLAGVAYSAMGAEEGSMGVDFSATSVDGLLDIAVSNFQLESTSLFRQEAPLLFREVSDTIGIGQAARARLKWGLDLFDADNDGDEDLIVANGHIDDTLHQQGATVSFAQQNTLYEHLGTGRFRDVSDIVGSALQDVQVSRGLATGDLDGDGALDFLVTNNGGKAQVGLNKTTPRGRFVGLWLEGTTANRSAIGARIVARIGSRTLDRQVMGSSSYLSICDLRVVLGLSDASAIDELTIHWPGSRPQVIRHVSAGQYYRVVEGRDPEPFVPGARPIVPLVR